ncbi:hypothetical protein MA16_Dca005070 [Dendrobium catenatum]|uniref:Uncharacterized protein n=1 Tax=Dendrobium catenatum TaxID=906689 RepID=A0A2I0WGW0_9ASPA|nr:hypothetical protein MA16_Dca005070 [Dendrobium catenatum]
MFDESGIRSRDSSIFEENIFRKEEEIISAKGNFDLMKSSSSESDKMMPTSNVLVGEGDKS